MSETHIIFLTTETAAYYINYPSYNYRDLAHLIHLPYIAGHVVRFNQEAESGDAFVELSQDDLVIAGPFKTVESVAVADLVAKFEKNRALQGEARKKMN